MNTPSRAFRAYRATQTDYFSLLEHSHTHHTLNTREVSAVSHAPERDRECAESALSAESPRTSRAALAAALLSDFSRYGDVHEVRMPGVSETLFIVPTADEGERLAARDGITRGRIWTARELGDILRSSATTADLAAVALAKIVLDGEVVATRARGVGRR